MPGFDYARMASTADRLMKRFKQGVVTVERSVLGDPPNPDEPWVPGQPVVTTYELDATVKSVEDKFIDGTTIFATDSMVTAGPLMTKTHVDGVAVTNEVVETNLAPGDVVKVDGVSVTIRKEMRVPKAGTLIAFKMIVSG